jgi:hypothetical protein
MKVLTTLLFITLHCVCFCQTNDFGRLSGDTLILNNGAKFIEGEKIHTGVGSNGSKGFEFIYTSPMSISGIIKLGSGWSNSTMVIKGFKNYGRKKTGYKFYIILGGGNIVNYWCDITPAIDNGEVIVEGVNDKATLNKKNSSGSEISVADELAKLKKLYDDGTLTKDEYETQKKKLLDK